MYKSHGVQPQQLGNIKQANYNQASLSVLKENNDPYNKKHIQYTSHQQACPSKSSAQSIKQLKSGMAITPSNAAQLSVPPPFAVLMDFYITISGLKQEMQRSIENCVVEWETLLVGRSFDIFHDECGIIELVKQMNPELGKNLEALHNLMNGMITIENECINLLEEVEDAVLTCIKKSSFYKQQPIRDWSVFLKRYQFSLHASHLKNTPQGHVNSLRQNLKQFQWYNCEGGITTLNVFDKKIPFTPKKDSLGPEEEAQFILEQGAFSLDQRSNRLQRVFHILQELKREEQQPQNQSIAKQVLTVMAAHQHHLQRHGAMQDKKQLLTHLDKILIKVQEYHDKHRKLLARIRRFEDDGSEETASVIKPVEKVQASCLEQQEGSCASALITKQQVIQELRTSPRVHI